LWLRIISIKTPTAFSTSAALMIINRLFKCTLFVDKLLGINSMDFDIDHLQIMYLHSSDTGTEMGIYWDMSVTERV
jgi:hypothetical protein